MLPGLSAAAIMSGGGSPSTYISSSGNASNTGTIVVNKPAGVQDGDLLVALAWSSSTTPVSASGWDVVATFTTSTPTLYVLKRRVDSDGASYTFSGSSSCAVTIIATRGGGGVVTVPASITGASSATSTAASINAPSAGILISSFGISNASATVSTPPGGMTLAHYESTAGAVSSSTYYLDPSPAGATGTKSVTWSTSTTVAAVNIQIS